MPVVLTVDPERPEPRFIDQAARVLAAGGLVAFPTETVYGLGARGLHEDEVRRIFAAKGRPQTHPLILHVDGEAMAKTLAAEWSERASALARAFWPGPLTLVVPKAAHVPDVVTGGLPSVGLRSPAHPVALALLRAVGEPLAAPSANVHTQVSATTGQHVVDSLGDRVDLVLDAGACAHGIESTVVDLASSPPRVLRPGAASLEALRAVVPELVYEAVSLASDVPRAAPGMAAKHYAPRARVVLTRDVAAASAELVKEGVTFSAITWSGAPAPGAIAVRDLGRDPVQVAHDLYAALHEVDVRGWAAVVIEAVPDEPAWWAIADRLRRAEVR